MFDTIHLVLEVNSYDNDELFVFELECLKFGISLRKCNNDLSYIMHSPQQWLWAAGRMSLKSVIWRRGGWHVTSQQNSRLPYV